MINNKNEYSYKFVTGEVIVLKTDNCTCENEGHFLSEQWIEQLQNLDREEYNNNHKETRRHCSLEAYNLDDTLLASSKDYFGVFDEKNLWNELSTSLTYRQKMIGDLYFRQGYTQNELAKALGVSQVRINQIIADIRKKLVKYQNDFI